MAQPAPVREPTLSLQEAAAELGLTVPSLRNWLWRGRIGYFKLGRVRVPVSEIQHVKRAAWRPPQR
jgi:excisionase family DNA binding protein